jgi:RNA polymerase sigma factor (sigma-70 family)
VSARRPENGRPNAGAVEPPDATIMSRLARGDSGALGELYDRHQESVRRFIARATSDAADVDDLLHATFLAAGKSAARYDGRDSCRPWLIGIAVQHIKRRRYAFGRFIALLTSLGGAGGRIVDPRAALDSRPDVQRALRLLSEAKRVTFLLAELEGLTCPEIGAALNVPIGTVWTRLHAARRELRRTLAGGDDL